MGRMVHCSTARRSRWCDGMYVMVSAKLTGMLSDRDNCAQITTLRNKTVQLRLLRNNRLIEGRLEHMLWEVQIEDLFKAGYTMRDVQLRKGIDPKRATFEDVEWSV